MTIFTDDFVSRIEDRYGKLISHRRPEIYHVATYPGKGQMRQQIEDLVSKFIREAAQKEFISNLCTEKFRDFYHELVVADKLTRLGYLMEYQPSLENTKRPDWYVRSSDGSIRFYLEVFTPSPSEKIIEAENKWQDLCKRIEGENPGFGIRVEAGTQCLPPDARQCKRLAVYFTNWLKNENPSVGDWICFHSHTLERIHDEFMIPVACITFEVRKQGLSPQLSWCSPPVKVNDINTDTLKSNIEVKTRKYGRILTDMQISFVVCLVPHPDSLQSHDTVEDALYGQPITIVYPQSDGRDVLVDTRKNNGIFTGDIPDNSTLSAVIWLQRRNVWYGRSDKPVIKPIAVYLNPKATFPVARDHLDFSRLEE